MVRNRVKRRLRAIVAADLPSLPAGARVVVRALPAAATASFSELSSRRRRGARVGGREGLAR